jgi:hypothetical protein
MVSIFLRDQKTPQMRHMFLLYNYIAERHDWVMFCDDDDNYTTNRIETFVKHIYNGEIQCGKLENKVLAGVYESNFGKDHREHRHEYWCYCVKMYFLGIFFQKLEKHPEIIDNKCCDVLFAEYLRRLGPNCLYARVEEKMYNYRVENNSDSITGYIQTKQRNFTRKSTPPPIGDPAFTDYVLEFNEHLHEHLGVYIHDTFLRTIVGCDLEYILKAEFRNDYEILKFVDECHVKQIKEKHDYWRSVCNYLFDIPLN